MRLYLTMFQAVAEISNSFNSDDSRLLRTNRLLGGCVNSKNFHFQAKRGPMAGYDLLHLLRVSDHAGTRYNQPIFNLWNRPHLIAITSEDRLCLRSGKVIP